MSSRSRFLTASFLCCVVCALGLEPKRMLGERPGGMTGYERANFERSGVNGTLYFNCDDTCVVAVDGKVVGSSSGMRTARVPLKLRPGSVIAARCKDTRAADGLALVFVAAGGKTSFVAGPQGWFSYTPARAGQWMDLAGTRQEDLRPCRKGTNDTWRLRLEKASGVACPQSIWASNLDTTVHIVHVVTYADLGKKAAK